MFRWGTRYVDCLIFLSSNKISGFKLHIHHYVCFNINIYFKKKIIIFQKLLFRKLSDVAMFDNDIKIN